jgi:hypothetical protein
MRTRMMSSKAGRLESSPSAPCCGWLESTYHAGKYRILSACAVSDAVLTPELVTLWEDNYRVYGVRKLCKSSAEPEETSAGTRRAG